MADVYITGGFWLDICKHRYTLVNMLFSMQAIGRLISNFARSIDMVHVQYHCKWKKRVQYCWKYFISERFRCDLNSQWPFRLYVAHMTVYSNTHKQILQIWAYSFQWWCWILVFGGQHLKASLLSCQHVHESIVAYTSLSNERVEEFCKVLLSSSVAMLQTVTCRIWQNSHCNNATFIFFTPRLYQAWSRQQYWFIWYLFCQNAAHPHQTIHTIYMGLAIIPWFLVSGVFFFIIISKIRAVNAHLTHL